MPTTYFAHGVASGDPLPKPSCSGPGSRRRLGEQAGLGCRSDGHGALAGARRHRPSPPSSRPATVSTSGLARPHRQGGRHRAGAGARTTSTASPTAAQLSPVGRTRTAPAPTPPRPTCASAWSPAPTPGGLVQRLPAPRRPRRPGRGGCTSATTSTSTAPASTATARATATSGPHEPAHEILTLADYRQPARAVQERPGPAAPAREVRRSSPPGTTTRSANDAWKGGAENHTDRGEGTWTARGAPPATRRTTSGCRSG